MVKRVAVVGSCSGVGKTTLARALSHKIGGTFVELDALRHGPNWSATPDDEIRASLAPIVATERWTIDAIAERTVGRLVLDRLDLIVWLDLPPWVWMPRLARRSARRWLLGDELWNGNRETLRGILVDRDGVFPHAIRKYFFRHGETAAIRGRRRGRQPRALDAGGEMRTRRFFAELKADDYGYAVEANTTLPRVAALRSSRAVTRTSAWCGDSGNVSESSCADCARRRAG